MKRSKQPQRVSERLAECGHVVAPAFSAVRFSRLLVSAMMFFGAVGAPTLVTAQIAELADVPRRTFWDWLSPSNESRAVWQSHSGERLNITEPGRAVSDFPHPAVVRVVVAEKNGASMGSGSLVYKTPQYGVVLTNWHVVRDATQGVLIVFPTGEQFQGRVLQTDEHWDLAAVTIPAPQQAEPLVISTVRPKPGEQLWIGGYGSGKFSLQVGRCSQYLAPYPQWPEDLVELAASARQGDSGGPILNAQGEIAGVLFGQGEGFTTGSFGGRVWQFLEQVPNPDALTQSWGKRPTFAFASSEKSLAQLMKTAKPMNATAAGGAAVTSVAHANSTVPDSTARYWSPSAGALQQSLTPQQITTAQQTAVPQIQTSPPTNSGNTNSNNGAARFASLVHPQAAVQPQAGVHPQAGQPITSASYPSDPLTVPAAIQPIGPRTTPASITSANAATPNKNQPNTISTAPISTSELSWEELTGKTWKQKAKTFGCLAGGAWLLWVVCGLLTKPRGESAAKEKSAKEKATTKDFSWDVEDEDADEDEDDWDEDDD